MRASFLLLGLTVSVFALNGCKAIMNPTFMPSGYTYHQDTYKSPPGPEASSIGYDYNQLKNDEIVQVWLATADEMVGELEKAGNVSAGPVYVTPPRKENAFTQSYDHALRNALRARGYTLLDTPDPQGLILTTGARVVQDGTASSYAYRDESDEPASALRDMILTLAAMRGEEKLGTLEGSYTLPTYGYQSAYYKKPSLPFDGPGEGW